MYPNLLLIKLAVSETYFPEGYWVLADEKHLKMKIRTSELSNAILCSGNLPDDAPR